MVVVLQLVVQQATATHPVSGTLLEGTLGYWVLAPPASDDTSYLLQVAHMQVPHMHKHMPPPTAELFLLEVIFPCWLNIVHGLPGPLGKRAFAGSPPNTGGDISTLACTLVGICACATADSEHVASTTGILACSAQKPAPSDKHTHLRTSFCPSCAASRSPAIFDCIVGVVTK